MHFNYTRIDDLSPLAWVARYQSDAHAFEVRHGRHVETQDHFFVEGAWAGDYPSGRMQDTDTLFGSGGEARGEHAVFTSCTATTDYLYHNDDANHFVIANSLPLLLASLDDALQIDCTEYRAINQSIADGIRHYQTRIPTRRGQVRRLMHSNLQFGPDGIKLLDKPAAPDFPNFERYRDFLRDRLREVFANARHAARKQPLQIFTTQSRGYDSTAVNALGAPFGIDRAFTCPESKDTQSFYHGGASQAPSDDGTDICAVLHIPCTPIDRRSFETTPLKTEVYYWAGLDNNSDLNLHEITTHITQPTLLLTGQYGEFWYTREITGPQRMGAFDDELKKWDLAGHGLTEVRLNAGFIQAAIPIIGSRKRTDILAITESPDMDAWRTHTTYDRPIPRRIAEEGGVPREMFGQTKLASIVHLASPNIPVTPALRDAFFRHLIEHRLVSHAGIRLLPLAQRLNNWIYWKDPNRYFHNRKKHPVTWHLAYAFSRLTGIKPRITLCETKVDSYLYAYCVNILREKFATSLARAARQPDDPVH